MYLIIEYLFNKLVMVSVNMYIDRLLIDDITEFREIVLIEKDMVKINNNLGKL